MNSACWIQQQYENRCANSIDQGRALALALSCKQKVLVTRVNTIRCAWLARLSSMS
jgi:hypothetical protein